MVSPILIMAIVIIIAAWVMYKDRQASASSVDTEKYKQWLLRIIQLIGLVSGFGLLGQVPIIASVLEALNLVAVEWDGIVNNAESIVNVAIAIWAIFRTGEADKVVAIMKSAYKSEAAASSLKGEGFKNYVKAKAA